jgi:hypothetical protein
MLGSLDRCTAQRLCKCQAASLGLPGTGGGVQTRGGGGQKGGGVQKGEKEALGGKGEWIEALLPPVADLQPLGVVALLVDSWPL